MWEEVIFIEVRENKYTPRNAAKESDFLLREKSTGSPNYCQLWPACCCSGSHGQPKLEITDWNKITTIKMVIWREYLTSGVVDTEKQTEHE